AAVGVHDRHVPRAQRERAVTTGEPHVLRRTIGVAPAGRDDGSRGEHHHERAPHGSPTFPRWMSFSSSCSVPKGSPERMRSIRRRLSSENQISALLFSEKMPFVLIEG